MKKLLFAFLFLPAVCSASEGLMNFNEIFKATRIGVFVDQHLQSRRGIYATLLNFHDRAGTEYVDLNIGYLEKLDPSPRTPLFQIGLRLDNLLARARSSAWGQAHTTLSELPNISFGPFLSGYLVKEDAKYKVNTIYGIGIAIGL